MNYYIGPWQLIKGVWTIPVPNNAAWDVIDMSPVGSHSHALVSTEEKLPAGYTLLANDWTAPATTRMRDALPGVNTTNGQTFSEMILDWFQSRSDPAGASAAKPVLPEKRGRYVLHLGRDNIAIPWRWGDSGTARIQALLQSDYEKIATATEQGKLPPRMDRKHLGAQVQKYKVDSDELLPQNRKRTRPQKPETDITDDFNRADGAIGASWQSMSGTASTINTNRARGGGYTFMNHATPLSASDYYSQVAFVVSGVGGVLARCTTGVNSCYAYQVNNSNDLQIMYKWTSGSPTQLGSNSQADVFDVPFTIKLDVNGSTLTPYINGSASSMTAKTDTTYSSQLLAGIHWDSTNEYVDDFFATDGLGGGGGGNEGDPLSGLLMTMGVGK